MSSTATSDAALTAEAAKENVPGPSKDTPTKFGDDFFKSTSLDDVDLSTTPPKLKGVVLSKYTVQTLRKFCSFHKIYGYKDKPKKALCDMIVNAAKTKDLYAAMYPDDANNGGSNASDDNVQSKKKKTTKKVSASTKPSAITKEGTYYRMWGPGRISSCIACCSWKLLVFCRILPSLT